VQHAALQVILQGCFSWRPDDVAISRFMALANVILNLRRRLLLAAVMLFSAQALANGNPRDPREFFFTQSFGDLPEELAAARQEGKLGLLLVYEAESCSYCEFMLRHVFNQPQVQDWYREHFISIAVDIHGDVELTDFDGITLPSKVFAEHRRVYFTPVMSFIDLQGDEIYRHAGMVRTPEEFMLIGEYIAGEHYFDTEYPVFAREHGRQLEPSPHTPAAATDHRLDERETPP
jgi:thioredoxin-related protein